MGRWEAEADATAPIVAAATQASSVFFK